MERYVALDIGDRRIGVAISDPYNSYALPSDTYFRKGRGDVDEIAKIIAEKGATCVVCGLPVNSDGSRSDQTEKTERFIEALKKRVHIPVVAVDERYTTVEAERTLSEQGASRDRKRKAVDSLAAAEILDGYLKSIKEVEGDMAKDEDRDEQLDEELSDENESDEEEGDGLESPEPDLVELVDEDGNIVKFKYLDVTEYKGKKYVLLLIAEPSEEFAEDEVVIFEEEEDEKGEVILNSVPDDDLLNEVFEFYQKECEEEGEDVYIDDEGEGGDES